MIFHTISTRS